MLPNVCTQTHSAKRFADWWERAPSSHSARLAMRNYAIAHLGDMRLNRRLRSQDAPGLPDQWLIDYTYHSGRLDTVRSGLKKLEGVTDLNSLLACLRACGPQGLLRPAELGAIRSLARHSGLILHGIKRFEAQDLEIAKLCTRAATIKELLDTVAQELPSPYFAGDLCFHVSDFTDRAAGHQPIIGESLLKHYAQGYEHIGVLTGTAFRLDLFDAGLQTRAIGLHLVRFETYRLSLTKLLTVAGRNVAWGLGEDWEYKLREMFGECVHELGRELTNSKVRPLIRNPTVRRCYFGVRSSWPLGHRALGKNNCREVAERLASCEHKLLCSEFAILTLCAALVRLEKRLLQGHDAMIEQPLIRMPLDETERLETLTPARALEQLSAAGLLERILPPYPLNKLLKR